MISKVSVGGGVMPFSPNIECNKESSCNMQ